MKYRNVTDGPLLVPTATAVEVVPPGETVLTSPTLVLALVEAGQLAVVQSKSRRGSRNNGH